MFDHEFVDRATGVSEFGLEIVGHRGRSQIENCGDGLP